MVKAKDESGGEVTDKSGIRKVLDGNRHLRTGMRKPSRAGRIRKMPPVQREA